MATRLYLGRESFSAIDPGVLGTWGFSYRQRYKAEPTKQSSAFSVYTITGMSTSDTTLMRQWITRPMDAGTTFNSSTTWTFTMQMSESSTALNIFPRYVGAIVSQTGIPRGYLWTNQGGNELGTSLAARQIVTTGLVGSYTSVSGDRLVFEAGWNKTASTSGSASIRIGDSGASDLSGEGDTGSSDNPWIECSETITFQAEGTAPTQGDNFQLTSYISGVLDEWV
jgi:hypothetical protein